MGIVSAVSGKLFSAGKIGGANLLYRVKYIAICVLLAVVVLAIYHALDHKDKLFMQKMTKVEQAESIKVSRDAEIFELFKGLRTGDPLQKQYDIKRIINSQTVRMRDAAGWTPLHWAAFHNERGLARLLVANGADTSAKTLSGHTPLEIAKAVSTNQESVYAYLKA